MDNELIYSIYREQFISLRRQSSRGTANIAKPLLLLATIKVISDGLANNNIIPIKEIASNYEVFRKEHTCSTPFQYPLYFLESDGFFHLKWKGEKIITKAPTGKMIRDNVDFAYFDNSLWDLLQDISIRKMYENEIIEYYL